MTDIARIEALVEDRAEDGVFRVRREVFNDPAIFDLEMKHVFDATWLFIGLESQAARPHDFFTTMMGAQPVIVMRDGDGRIGCFLNTCRHRGAQVTSLASGNQRVHVCPYHGWTYTSGGANCAIPKAREGRYPPAFAAENHDLVAVPAFANYRGMLFASLSADVAPIERHLGDARIFLDLLIDQSPQGLEFVPGTVTYTFDGNWKLQIDNPLDGYHFDVTHGSYIDVIRGRRREARNDIAIPQLLAAEPDGSGHFALEHGHSVYWYNYNATGTVKPVNCDAEQLARLEARVGPRRAKWMLINRNLNIYPNMQIIDNLSTQLRLIRPLGPGKTEMISRCLAPIGESASARRRRIRQYEDFFNPSGMATPDDAAMFERCQAGSQAAGAGWLQGYVRGLGGAETGPSRHAEELGLRAREWSYGPSNFGGETLFYPAYRETLRLLKRGLGGN